MCITAKTNQTQTQENNKQNQHSCSADSSDSEKNTRDFTGNHTPPPILTSSVLHQSYLDQACGNHDITPSTIFSSASTNQSKSLDDNGNDALRNVMNKNTYSSVVGDTQLQTSIVQQQNLEIPDLESNLNSNSHDNSHSLRANFVVHSMPAHSDSSRYKNTNLIAPGDRGTTAYANGNGNVSTGSNLQSHPDFQPRHHTSQAPRSTYSGLHGNIRDTHQSKGPAVVNSNGNVNIAGPPRNTYANNASRMLPSSQCPPASYQQIASHHQHQHQHQRQTNMHAERRQNVSPSTAPSSPHYRHSVSLTGQGNVASYAANTQSISHTPQRDPQSAYYHPTHEHITPGGRVRSSSISEQRGSRRSHASPMQSPSHNNWQHQNKHQSSRNAHYSSGRNMIPNSPGHHQRQQFSQGGGARSPPEVLKTLLRKKACLYEPCTSRAITLVTWLVARKLGLAKGYFSRQTLQAGVHAVVSKKIESGMITRTKVNRCMQIILNSCFYYIIPRPDGLEEDGGPFSKSFQESVVDDTHLLKSLLAPWDDLDILEADKVMYYEEEEGLEDDGGGGYQGTSRKSKTSKCKEENGKGKHLLSLVNKGKASQPKRAVLLCFHENVRSAEDILRCHNEFIRDAAISANLFLTSDEWRFFYTRKDDDSSQSITTADSNASVGACVYSSPMMRGAEGCDIPYLSFDIPSELSDSLAFNDTVPDTSGKNADVRGQMNSNELSKFRTTWCCKRYDHDATLCRFAHVNENKGWLRRDPTIYDYKDELCGFTATITNDDSVYKGCFVNACKNGLLCRSAHSQEEVDYHPVRYKNRKCTNKSRPCNLLDICPHSHPDSERHIHHPNRRRGDSIPNGKGVLRTSTAGPEEGETPKILGGSPVLYLSPAPMSKFDNAFQFAGFQSLFRRNCTVHFAHHAGVEGARYTLFADTCGIDEPLFKPSGEGGKGSFSLYSE